MVVPGSILASLELTNIPVVNRITVLATIEVKHCRVVMMVISSEASLLCIIYSLGL